jgi:hypothetical protein
LLIVANSLMQCSKTGSSQSLARRNRWMLKVM